MASGSLYKRTCPLYVWNTIMTKIIEKDSVVPAWLAAARHLNAKSGRVERNLILEIATPTQLTAVDMETIATVDRELKRNNAELSVDTVAGTIFPNGLYRRFGRPELYERYLNVMTRAQKPGTWGTYAMRMFQRRIRNGKSTFNPLETIVCKLTESKKRKFRSVYELSTIDIESDLLESSAEISCELPIYDSISDRNRPTNIPCLSHLSFKLNGSKIDLTAVYRSHHYAQRALGNLIGLSQLQSFVATESTLECGVLTCIATHAYFDAESWGGVKHSAAILNSLPSEQVSE